MLGVGRIANRSDAYAKYSSNDQKMAVTMREAELSNATESLAIERSDLPVGIANGALLPPRIVAKHIGSVSYGAGHAPTQHLLLYLACLPHPQCWRQRRKKGFPFYLTWRQTPGCLCATLSRPPRPASCRCGSQCYLERRERLPWRLLCRT